MTITPRSEIRTWIREQLDAGMAKDDITFAAIQHFLDRDDIIAELVSTAVTAEANQVLGITIKTYRNPSTHHASPTSQQDAVNEEAAALPADSPLAKLTPQFDTKRSAEVMLNLSRMTKPEVLNLASEFESAAQKNEELAAFLRSVAAGLQNGQTVGDTFTREHLLNLRNRLTTHSTTRVFLGQRQIAITERTN